MTRYERATQIWAVLAWIAKHRQSITYSQLGRLIGVPSAGLGKLLEPIQAYCLVNQLPPLTVLVVQQDSGLPGSGFIGAPADEFARAQSQVFSFDWLERGNPQPDGFAEVVAEHGSSPSRVVASDEVGHDLGLRNPIRLALLFALGERSDARNGITPSEIYGPVADLLAIPAHERTVTIYERNGSGESEPWWPNAVRWARDHLRRQGLLDGAERGVWRLTEAGKQEYERVAAGFSASGSSFEEFSREWFVDWKR